ncbi:hypothetical protein FRC08_005837 [Ceratobasidium sp. 394]|nr:hypothetical protein FRC08_005837 [Ceratobasidium sp. 394]
MASQHTSGDKQRHPLMLTSVDAVAFVYYSVTGFGWLADNLWRIVTGLIPAPVVQEFSAKGPFLKLAQNIELLVGALGWGVGSDIWGRKISFNTTLAIVGVFATVASKM